MIKLNPNRKNKIDLKEYNYQQDIRNRLLLAQLTDVDLLVLQELLNRPLQVSIIDLADTLGITSKALAASLEKLGSTGLFKPSQDAVTVNKELRKYFESQIVKFDPDFQPGMEFVQSLLKKVPIHTLPIWYSIPRSSDNILQSLLEKFFLTPRVFQRYLLELNFNDPIMTGIMEDVFYQAPDFKVDAQQLRKKYHLSHEEFEEYLLHLEFNFLCCLCYEKVDGHWKEIVTPFHEWHQYLRFLRDSQPKPITSISSIKTKQSSEFAFINELTELLEAAKRKNFKLKPEQANSEAVRVLTTTGLATLKGQILQCTSDGQEWLAVPPEKKAVALSRHAGYRFAEGRFSEELNSDKNFREIERGMERLANVGWIYVDDFLKGLMVPVGKAEDIALKKRGRVWEYAIPSYSEEEQAFIRATVLERLAELGIVQTGVHHGKECFCVSPFGRFRLLGHQ